MALSQGIPPIEIRHCTTLDEYKACVDLEHVIWGEDIAVPSAIFVVAHHTGGQVIGAFEGSGLLGFTLALAGIRGRKPFLHSHMAAVSPDHQNRGIGRSLKLFQREDALKRGMDLIEWTFDPLELKNAHFNLVRLGAVVSRYILNCYGITASPLHAGLPTDRLVAQWWIDSGHVKAILEGRPLPSNDATRRLTLPANIGEIKSQDQAAAARIQTGARGQFMRAFADGYVATSLKSAGIGTDYIFEKASDIAGLPLPETRED